MSKRKTSIELQSKPSNSAMRQIIEKTKPVEYAPLAALSSNVQENQTPPQNTETAQPQIAAPTNGLAKKRRPTTAKPPDTKAVETKIVAQPSPKITQERLRIFQTSSPHTRAVAKFHKAAIVVRGANGKETIELSWRDQMNEKTRDIWDYLVTRFAENSETREITLRKRDVLENSGVKSDRTFINAIYTLEDMNLIEVRRLSGNKEGNIYVLTDEGREEAGI